MKADFRRGCACFWMLLFAWISALLFFLDQGGVLHGVVTKGISSLGR